MAPDAINGLLEFFASGFMALSILKVCRNRSSKGVSCIHVTFFCGWGFWNLYYYPHLDQWFSLLGGIGVVITNTVWAILLFKYRRQ